MKSVGQIAFRWASLLLFSYREKPNKSYQKSDRIARFPSKQILLHFARNHTITYPETHYIFTCALIEIRIKYFDRWSYYFTLESIALNSIYLSPGCVSYLDSIGAIRSFRCWIFDAYVISSHCVCKCSFLSGFNLNIHRVIDCLLVLMNSLWNSYDLTTFYIVVILYGHTFQIIFGTKYVHILLPN